MHEQYCLADFVKACDCIQSLDWDALLFDKDINEAWQIWERTFMSIIEQCIPKGVLPK